MTIHTPLRVCSAIAIAVAIAACGPSGAKIDAGPGSDGRTPDASPFGTACQGPMDCPGGFCVEGFGDRVCSAECTQGCPSGWECRATRVDGDLLSICVPPAFELCTPCTGDTQCGAGVCVTLGGSGFCLPQCPFEGSCPQGYTCGPDPTGKNEGDYCVPMTSACTCTSGADQGQRRTCSKMNGIGTCQGLETCDPGAGGWTGCTAPDANTELCDGIDNDCNSIVDDGVASGQACTITTAGIGSCPGLTLCAGGTGVICQGKTPVAETCNNTDDDCNNGVDEGFPGLNTVCNAGVGGCQRVGIVRCTPSGAATECTAVAGSPIAELCNAVDDDCDTRTDEAFPAKGQACTTGVGACLRAGSQVCATNGMSTTCSVAAGTPGTESCNTIDDDCDTRVDEDFKDGSGQYTRNNACGSCAIDCTAIFGLPNSFGTCVAGPQCALSCVPGAFNLDSNVTNGCEFLIEPTAIYVSAEGAGSADDATCGLGPTGTGAGNHPCLTIAQGIARATALNRNDIFVANGIYSESVTLANGRNLRGGYRPDNWVRDLAATGTVIAGVRSIGNHDLTVDASNITQPTVLEGFAIYGSVNAKPTGNSYAIYVASSTANLAIRNNVILAGRGGPGVSGTAGVDGADGTNGAGRNPNFLVGDAAYDAKRATGPGLCAPENDREYANGGVMSCGGDDVSGGNGGGNVCPASMNASCICGGVCPNCGCSSCTFETTTPRNGVPGQPGAGPAGGTAGGFGARGEDMIVVSLSGGTVCPVPTSMGNALPTNGFEGKNGATGGNGAGVAGCTGTGGSIVGGHWVGAAAPVGLPGSNGGGGGGGGAGGGAKCHTCSEVHDNLGGHGGGGGAGGCGGTGGTGATAGGGAFAIFVAGGTAPVITNNTMFRGEGGGGGAGGGGGRGGAGGTGGSGGTQGQPALFCSDVAGRGGNGGKGGNGSGGGGSCGGSSYGVFTAGVGTPNYCQAGAANTFVGGVGGAGGPGGFSTVSPGGAGAMGLLLDCSFN